jgi:hypothetical protein
MPQQIQQVDKTWNELQKAIQEVMEDKEDVRHLQIDNPEIAKKLKEQIKKEYSNLYGTKFTVDMVGNNLIITKPEYGATFYNAEMRRKDTESLLEERGWRIRFPLSFPILSNQRIPVELNVDEFKRTGLVRIPPYLMKESTTTENIEQAAYPAGSSFGFDGYTLHLTEITSLDIRYDITKNGAIVSSGTGRKGESIKFKEGNVEAIININDITTRTVEESGTVTTGGDLGARIDSYYVYGDAKENGKAYVYYRKPNGEWGYLDDVVVGTSITIDEGLTIKVTNVNWDPEYTNRNVSFDYTLRKDEPYAVLGGVVNRTTATYSDPREYFTQLQGKSVTARLFICDDDLTGALGASINRLSARIGEQKIEENYLSLNGLISKDFGWFKTEVRGDVGKRGSQLGFKFDGKVRLLPGSDGDFYIAYKFREERVESPGTLLKMIDRVREIKISQPLFNDIKNKIGVNIALGYTAHDNTLRLEKWNPELPPEQISRYRAKAEDYIKSSILTPTLSVFFKGLDLTLGVVYDKNGKIVGGINEIKASISEDLSLYLKIDKTDVGKSTSLGVTFRF